MRGRCRVEPTAALLFLTTASVYLMTASRTVVGGDNGEFATLLVDGGVAHPPGYPLFSLWLRLCSFLPASPAHAAALATAVTGIVAVMVVRRACLAYGAEPLAATAAAGVYAFSPLAWDLSTHAEVFALNALLASGVMALSSPRSTVPAFWRAVLLALLAGLGLAHHHSIVLLVPLGAVGFALAVSALPGPERLRAMGWSLGGFVAGLTPYLWTMMQGAREDGRWLWGETATWRGLLHHVLRADYGTTRLALSDAPPQPAAQLLLLGSRLGESLGYLLVPVALLGLWTAFRPAAHRDRRMLAASVSLAASCLLAGPAFVSRFNVAPVGVGMHVVARFHLLPWTCLVPFLALGFNEIGRRIVVQGSVRAMTAAAAVAGVLMWHLPARLKRPSVVEDYLRNSLAMCPPRAVVFGSGDMQLFGFLYADRALHLRPDVTYVDPQLMLYPWYHRRVGAKLGVELAQPVDGSLPLGTVIAQLQAAGRPVLLASPLESRGLAAYTIYPLGTLLVVEPPGHPAPPPSVLERENLAVAARYQVQGRLSVDSTSWEALAQQAYARPFLALAGAFEDAGDADAAARNRERAAVFLPWMR